MVVETPSGSHTLVCRGMQQISMSRVGQNHVYIRYIDGIFGREITYTVIYSVYIRSWPTLQISESTAAIVPLSVADQVRFFLASETQPLGSHNHLA